MSAPFAYRGRGGEALAPSKSKPVRRREFLKASLAAAGAVALGPSFWERLYAASVETGPGPYGPLQPPDANGLMLPPGFSSRIVARSGLPVAGTAYVWHIWPDGAFTFPAEDGGWIHVVNSEAPLPIDIPLASAAQRIGGASAIRFDASGEIVDAYRVLGGTRSNCAGGATPWGTWISCEEFDESNRGGSTANAGNAWECDPTGRAAPIKRTALGTFKHEAVAFEPAIPHRAYLTEDLSDGRFYRFTPATRTGTPSDLDAGALEAAELVGPAGGPWDVVWHAIPDPSASTTSTRNQAPETTAFDGGEGCFHDAGIVYFTTKGDNRVWRYHIATETLDLLYDAAAHPDPVLTGVDNVIVSRAGDVYVAEDGGNLEICVITPDNHAAPVVRATGPQHGFDNPLPPPFSQAPTESEISGPAFSPDGSRLYFNSQRAYALGVTYEVSGPFRMDA